MQGVAITFEPKDFLHIKEVGQLDTWTGWLQEGTYCG